MDSSIVVNKIYKLPEHLVSQVNEFVDSLMNEEKHANENVEADMSQPKAGYGGMKGLFVIHDDFDEPLDDFKEYM